MNKKLVIGLVEWITADIMCFKPATNGSGQSTSERSVGTITDDAIITSKINAQYVKDKSVSAFDINVDTYRGVVTLHGSVGSKASADRAISIARGVSGVKKVISQLTIVSEK